MGTITRPASNPASQAQSLIQSRLASSAGPSVTTKTSRSESAAASPRARDPKRMTLCSVTRFDTRALKFRNTACSSTVMAHRSSCLPLQFSHWARHSRGLPRMQSLCGPKSATLRSRYEITCTSISISLRLLMPFRNVSAQLIPLQRRTGQRATEIFSTTRRSPRGRGRPGGGSAPGDRGPPGEGPARGRSWH